MRKIRKIWCVTWKYEQKTLILSYFGQKWPILDHFWPKKGQFWIFDKKAKWPFFYIYKVKASWEKSEKSDASLWKYEQTSELTMVPHIIGHHKSIYTNTRVRFCANHLLFWKHFKMKSRQKLSFDHNSHKKTYRSDCI